MHDEIVFYLKTVNGNCFRMVLTHSLLCFFPLLTFHSLIIQSDRLSFNCSGYFMIRKVFFLCIRLFNAVENRNKSIKSIMNSNGKFVNIFLICLKGFVYHSSRPFSRNFKQCCPIILYRQSFVSFTEIHAWTEGNECSCELLAN